MNTTSKFSKNRKILFGGALIVVILIFAAAVSMRPSSKQKSEQPNGHVVLQGELICLPHKNTDGPQTLECAIGFKSSEGKNYSLKDSTHKATTMPLNTHVEVTGTYQAESSDRYQVIGSIEVESIK